MAHRSCRIDAHQGPRHLTVKGGTAVLALTSLGICPTTPALFVLPIRPCSLLLFALSLWGSGLSRLLYSLLTLLLEMVILIHGFRCHLSSVFYIQLIFLLSRLIWLAAQQTSPVWLTGPSYSPEYYCFLGFFTTEAPSHMGEGESVARRLAVKPSPRQAPPGCAHLEVPGRKLWWDSAGG